MTYDDAVEHFDRCVDLARALELDRRTVHAWSKRRIPSVWQLRIERITKGKLQADRQAKDEAREFAGYARHAA